MPARVATLLPPARGYYKADAGAITYKTPHVDEVRFGGESGILEVSKSNIQVLCAVRMSEKEGPHLLLDSIYH